jgi:hypothetical protein
MDTLLFYDPTLCIYFIKRSKNCIERDATLLVGKVTVFFLFKFGPAELSQTLGSTAGLRCELAV